MKTRAYMDLTTDYAFKRVFASENNKDLLISLIRQGGTYDVSLKRKWDQEAARQLQEQQLETAIKQSLDEERLRNRRQTRD